MSASTVTETRTERDRGGLRAVTLLLGAAIAAVAILAALAPNQAKAYVGINEFSLNPSSTQAGGHPDLHIVMDFDNRGFKEGVFSGVDPESCECEDVKQIDVHMPTGFIGNPHSPVKCSLNEFTQQKCPPESQVGVILIGLSGAIAFGGQIPIYNMEPHPGEPGLIAFKAPFIGSPVFIVLHGRTGSDYGLDSTSVQIYHVLPINRLDLHLWGVPAESSHDPNRQPSPQNGCNTPYPEPCPGAVKSNASPEPYLQNPTTCSAPLAGSLDLTYYDGATAHAETSWPPTTGCDLLDFNPSLTANPTTTSADSPTGLDVDLKVPQEHSATTPAPSEIRSVRATLPEGFSINPNAADGKVACTDAEAAFGTENEAQCPENAKIGVDEVDSTALPGPIEGGIYLGQPLPGDRYRFFLTADGFATHVKLAGSVHLDPQSGQVVAEFNDLPQSPLQRFTMHLFGSERGLLATPPHCGRYAVETEFTPWNNVLPTEHSTSFFMIDTGPNGTPCPDRPRTLRPTMTGGSTDNTAGRHSQFGVEWTRPDGDQNLIGLNITVPPGLTATLAGIPYCPESALAQLADAAYSGRAEEVSSACPVASLVGRTVAAAGAGSRPLHAAGKVYLAGPHKGAPLSFMVVIPAVSGPYDLGNIAVRAAVYVDPVTARVTTVSDPLPQMVEGIPLRARMVRVVLDRPGFTLNPTNCDPFAIVATLFGDEGGFADLSSNYQVANCASLPYSPKLAMKLTGGVRRLGHPSIHAQLSAASGEANLKTVSVTLPRGELLDNSHIGTVCTRVDFAKDACPGGSLLGQAEVTSPLIDQPLKGPVYLRSSSQQLPDLALDLEGQFDIVAIGRIDSVGNGRLRTTFDELPDAPVGTVTLDLLGGSKGLLQNSETLCGVQKFAVTTMVGQNGARFRKRVRLRPDCRGPRGKRQRAGRSTKQGRR